MDVEEEVKKLVEEMTRLGERDDAGVLKVKFGVLFRDEACQQIFEALIGTARGRESGPLPWRPPGCPVIFPAPSVVFWCPDEDSHVGRRRVRIPVTRARQARCGPRRSARSSTSRARCS